MSRKAEAPKQVTFIRPMPLGDDGIETDIRTGRPLMETMASRRKSDKVGLEKEVDEGLQLQLQLADPSTKSNVMLKAVLDALSNQVELLAAACPVCQSLIMVLASVGAEVRLGPEMARRKLAQYLGSDLKLIPGAAPQGTPAPRKKPKTAP